MAGVYMEGAARGYSAGGLIILSGNTTFAPLFAILKTPFAFLITLDTIMIMAAELGKGNQKKEMDDKFFRQILSRRNLKK